MRIYYSLEILVVLTILIHSQTPLLLTQGHRQLIKSLPGYEGLLPFTLETGYIGVGGGGEEVELFSYFVESERDVGSDALMLWLTGGPGCSAFSGLIYEIGPLSFDYARSIGSDVPKLLLNPYSWTKVASIIFLDSPAGSGFSYANNYDRYHGNDTLQSSQIYHFMAKWFLDHPNFTCNPLYIAGDSYSGMIVPRVVQHILNGNENGLVPKMNLKGYALGNPSTVGKRAENARVDYQHRVSFISDELYQVAKRSCNDDFVNVNPRNIKCVRALATIVDGRSAVTFPHILEPLCPESKVSRKPHVKAPIYKHQAEDDNIDSLSLFEHQDYRPWCRGDTYGFSSTWANNVKVREALNIREGTIDRWMRCNNNLPYTPDDENSVVGYHKNLSNTHLHVLVYSGDQDFGETYIGTLRWIEELQLPTKEEWRPWFVGGQVAGYVTEYGNSSTNYRLLFTTVKGAGHTAPEYKPKEGLAMIQRWFESSSL